MEKIQGLYNRAMEHMGMTAEGIGATLAEVAPDQDELEAEAEEGDAGSVFLDQVGLLPPPPMAHRQVPGPSGHEARGGRGNRGPRRTRAHGREGLGTGAG